MAKVKVINKATGVASYYTQEKWDKLKSDPKWGKVFKESEPPSVPIEVQNLEAAKSAKVEVEPTKPAAKKTVRKPAAKKTSKNNTGN